MSQAHTADPPLAPATAGEPLAPHDIPKSVHDRVEAYWRRLGVSDAALLERLTWDCLHRAKHRVARGSEEELLLRSMEEAQRRLDHALARALGLPPAVDAHTLAAVRAAFLMGDVGLSADNLFRSGDPSPEFQARLWTLLPKSTPPEAPMSMPEAPLRFWLFKSPDIKHHR